MTVERLEVEGLEIVYERAGSGQPLVLLHGFLGCSNVFHSQLRDLSSDYMVVAWDGPGAGRSAEAPDSFRLSDHGRCLGGFLDHLGLGQVHLGGLSWGGVVAQELYNQRPDLVRSLILIDSYAGWAGSFGGEVAAQRLKLSLEDSELSVEEFAGRWAPGMVRKDPPDDVLSTAAAQITEHYRPAGFRNMARSVAEADTRHILSRIHVPTLLVWGQEDQRSPLAVAERIQSAIPRAELIVIPSAGHLSNVEQPEAFNRALLQFLARFK
jgi:pimeloyl-ACP methyl ester carboxylesterase